MVKSTKIHHRFGSPNTQPAAALPQNKQLEEYLVMLSLKQVVLGMLALRMIYTVHPELPGAAGTDATKPGYG
jgi:hypothetical protein